MKKFTKADLKDGYVVTYRFFSLNGIANNKRVVTNNCTTLSDLGSKNLAAGLNEFADDLTYPHERKLDIMRVECPQCGVLWEREGFETVKEEVEDSVITLHGHPIKLGDKVFDPFHGQGEVVRINSNSYPLVISFSKSDETYTSGGKFYIKHPFPRLGWVEEYDVSKLSQTKPLKKVKKWVWLYSALGSCGRRKFLVTAHHYTTAQEALRGSMETRVLYRIEESMIEVEEG